VEPQLLYGHVVPAAHLTKNRGDGGRHPRDVGQDEDLVLGNGSKNYSAQIFKLALVEGNWRIDDTTECTATRG
jgi:hypothetical protein